MRKMEKVSHGFRFAKTLSEKNQNQPSKRDSNYVHLLVVASTDVHRLLVEGPRRGFWVRKCEELS